MNENKINEIALQRIAEELEGIWEIDGDTLVNVCFVVKGILALRDDLIDALAARPVKEE